MKKILLILTLIGSLNITNFAQAYLKHYEAKSFSTAAPVYEDQRFTCLTTLNENILIAGIISRKATPTTFPPSDFGITIMETSTSGVVLNNWSIDFGLTEQLITPMAIQMIEGYAIICGTIGDYKKNASSKTYEADIDRSHAFVLKYNLSTNSVIWLTVLNEDGNDVDYNIPSAFLDLDRKNSNVNTDYLVCGEMGYDLNVDGEEACLYNVNQGTGDLTLIRNFRPTNGGTPDPASDTFFALYRDPIEANNINLVGRFEFPNYTGFDHMRPVYFELGTAGGVFNNKYYVVEAFSNVARLYGLDIARAGNNYVQIATGDINGDNAHEDRLLIKTDLNGGLIWAKNYTWGGLKRDGQFHSIKPEKVNIAGASLVNYIIWGSQTTAAAVYPRFDKPYLMKVSSSGTPTNIQFYEDILVSTTLCPNSMIAIDNANKSDDIYAVGYYRKNDIEYGALLHTNGLLEEVSDCDESILPTVSTILYESSFTYDTPIEEWDKTIVEVSSTFESLSVVSNPECVIPRAEYSSPLESQEIGVYYLNSGIKFVLPSSENFDNTLLTVYNMFGERIIIETFENEYEFNLIVPKGIYFANFELNDGSKRSCQFVVK